ncbi:MAG TPA: TRAM domain-containing protein [Dictyoglomaceae bacterium]|nr:TRAM domain-containing protein [Dictyoglomaceae bacterium]HOL39119.1 TRAM domain-containing protein [Dictyoglomaceae bacterium]HOP94272.1 TRAM domain-containing protein [Dictyoglomaceae bacterium]HPP15273.1 TRAM domain-containing protein [Dictyoglomaceae bacterium]HPU42679.1 TRAM domain-containing protein [Dictyoglomaceae bacterium]
MKRNWKLLLIVGTFILFLGLFLTSLFMVLRENRSWISIFNLFLTSIVFVMFLIIFRKFKFFDFSNFPSIKILDTSVIIDGRIVDILKTNFIEGKIVIPRFVLKELQQLADSSESLKKNRGRFGLDNLSQVRKELEDRVMILDTDFPKVQSVDTKLVKLAKSLGGKIVTNDYGLNKLAKIEGITVLNINELANAVKPIYLPGEELALSIIKEGKEAGQGVAYLDDGTMVVVENGKKYIGQTIKVAVTSVFQTAAGRLIFGRVKEDKESWKK